MFSDVLLNYTAAGNSLGLAYIGYYLPILLFSFFFFCFTFSVIFFSSHILKRLIG